MKRHKTIHQFLSLYRIHQSEYDFGKNKIAILGTKIHFFFYLSNADNIATPTNGCLHYAYIHMYQQYCGEICSDWTRIACALVELRKNGWTKHNKKKGEKSGIRKWTLSYHLSFSFWPICDWNEQKLLQIRWDKQPIFSILHICFDAFNQISEISSLSATKKRIWYTEIHMK